MSLRNRIGKLSSQIVFSVTMQNSMGRAIFDILRSYGPKN